MMSLLMNRMKVEKSDFVEEAEVGRYARSFGLSFAITSLISALLVILKETNEDTVLAWMAAATGHHWVTHGLMNLILFGALGWGFSRMNNGEGVKIKTSTLVIFIAGAVVLSGLIIVGFYA